MGFKSRKTAPKHELKFVQGQFGHVALYLNNYRIAGEKPWGGGKALRTWKVDEASIQCALRNKRL